MESRPLGKSGISVSAVGMGTWAIVGKKGSNASRDEEAVTALKHGLDLGLTFIDTAEMYSAGHSEEVVGKAISSQRQEAFVASKVSPSHFSYEDVLRSAGSSLRRLGLKQMDLYQLHWPNPSIPITETMKAMEKLVSDGLIRYIGVSNFSVQQTREAQAALSRERIVSNQVEYSLIERSVEEKLIPYCKKESITVIAYSPLAQGRIPSGTGASFDVLDEVAERVGKTRSQIALNWLLRDKSVTIIPKAANIGHLNENADVTNWSLPVEDHQRLSRAFS